MIRYLVFKRNYTGRNNYKFIKNVKYLIKEESINSYHTIKNTKISKKLEDKVYNVFETC